MDNEQRKRFEVLKTGNIMTHDELLEAYILSSDECEKLRDQLANLRQRNEDTDALLLIARAERDTARQTQEQLQDELAAMARWRDIAMRYADTLEDILMVVGATR